MKYFTTIIVIIILVVAGIYLTGHQDWLGGSTQQIQNPTNVQPVSPTSLNPTSVSQPPTPSPAPSSKTEASASLTTDLNYITTNFNALAQDFDTDTPFFIQGIWVQSNNTFYVEYKNKKSTLGQILVTKANGKFEGSGYFSPSESGWVLQAGQGDLMQANAVLYGKNEQGKWLRKN